ncbi:Man1-Src1p-C-terminal domain-containing protein [Mycena olivaceomarginata]|nr:Man1-Src1p-C-terminal domain-containing protein [Mycena olivaceomarginata]
MSLNFTRGTKDTTARAGEDLELTFANAHRQEEAASSDPLGILMRVLAALLILAASGVVVNYMLESVTIGYCTAGRNTNPTLEAMRARRLAVEVCSAENPALLPDGTPCPLPALPGLPRPDSCTLCPVHATCSQFRVEACDTGHLLKQHPLLFFLPARAESRALGSIGLLPRCIEDPERKLKIGALGRRVELELGAMRGRRTCAQRQPSPFSANKGGEARRWGVDIESLAGLMREKTKRLKNSETMLVNFHRDYQDAIQQLSEWGGIIIEKDARSRKRYIALKVPHFSWDCAISVRVRQWEQWQCIVFWLVLALLGGSSAPLWLVRGGCGAAWRLIRSTLQHFVVA